MITMPAPAPEADADIHSCLRAGDYRLAFELLLPRYRDRIFRLALSILRNRSDAEDATQDVLLRLWRALRGYDGRAALSTWIYAVSRNACLSQLRKRRAQMSLDDPDMVEHSAISTLGVPPVDDAAVASVTQLLDRLPERYRRVVILFYMEDKSCEQTGAALGLPVGTVKALLHRARRRMIDLVRGAGDRR